MNAMSSGLGSVVMAQALSSEHSHIQIDNFRDLAHELECDEDEAAFDERLKQIAPKAKVDATKP